MVDIIKGVKEIMDKKDPASGSRGGLLTGITKGVNEVLDNTINKIGTFGAPGRNYALIGKEGKKGGGIHEYGMSRDMAEAFNESFLDSAAEGKESGGFLGFLGGMAKGVLDGGIAGANAKRLWDTDIREPAMRLNSVLEERSYVDFYFPNLGIGNQGRRRVAFFENPEIKENRLARYATQNIVARNEPARLYVGSGPRKLTLNFTFTLPHVEYFFKMCYEASLLGFQNNSYIPPNRRQFKGASPDAYLDDWQRFTAAHLGQFFGGQFKTGPGGSAAEIAQRNTAGSLLGGLGSAIGFLGSLGSANSSEEVGSAFRRSITDKGAVIENRGVTGPRFYEPTFQEPKNGYAMRDKEKTANETRHMMQVSRDPSYIGKESMGMMATYYTQFVIDTIRASVAGDNVNGGQYGPPILRFRHGTLFNEAPFIVKSFTINYPTDKGYEYRTLVPRQVKFSLNLEEFHQVHGSHHGDIAKEQVPDATDILDLKLP